MRSCKANCVCWQAYNFRWSWYQSGPMYPRIQHVSPQTMRKVGQNFGVRIKACLNRRGTHTYKV